MGEKFSTKKYKIPADLFTPVSIYLRLRDLYRETILLESTDKTDAENSKSIIAINPIAGMEISANKEVEIKLPLQPIKNIENSNPVELFELFQQEIQFENECSALSLAQGMYGYTGYDAAQIFEGLEFSHQPNTPILRYRFYQYVLVIDHFHDELILLENQHPNLNSEKMNIISAIQNKDVPVYPFRLEGEENTDISNEKFLQNVKKGIQHCLRGDVFQVVLSRAFSQRFQGDEFQVYRALRTVNPSPYLFYFDYTDYKIFGSSPESQIILKDNQAKLHPIAGTFRRTGDDSKDFERAKELLTDQKENAEHTMLVDLARNDLSKVCKNVKVSKLKEIQMFSHVIHMVSEVRGEFTEENPFKLIAATFPQGTLSGAPKHRALQIIDENENSARGYYGGCIGFIGFRGEINHAIIIRSFLSQNNQLNYRAGAGVVAKSLPESELKEVEHKLGALKTALRKAEKF